jgi:membrane protease YdiL (CAAX protease family)
LRLLNTTRNALAPVFRKRTVFNLALYELLVIILIFAGEGLLFAGYSLLAVGVQAFNILAVAVIVVMLQDERVQLVEALALIPVFGVASSLFAHVSIIYSLAVVSVMFLPLIVVIPTLPLLLWVAFYGVMFIPIVTIIAHQKLNRNDLGLTGGFQLTYLIPLGALVGVGLGLIEYAILGNDTLIPNASASELIGLSIVMIFFVALVEELLFRVLLQPQLVERSSALVGVLITSVLFGAIHAIYANAYEILFTTGAGVVFGIAFYKTKNLPFVVTMHAVDDIVLFGVLPFLPLTLPH